MSVLLEDFMITPDEAIQHIRSLNQNFWVRDDKPNYNSSNAYVFKKEINKKVAYIKIKIEEDEAEEILVVISFHRDT